MRNKYFRLGIGVALLCIAGGIHHASVAQEKTEATKVPEQESQAEKTQEPQTNNDGKTDAIPEEKEAPDAKAPKRFIPSQRTPADNSASFPVDI